MGVLNGEWPPDPRLPIREQIQRLMMALDAIVEAIDERDKLLESLPVGATEVITLNQRQVESHRAMLKRHEEELAALRRRVETLMHKLET